MTSLRHVASRTPPDRNQDTRALVAEHDAQNAKPTLQALTVLREASTLALLARLSSPAAAAANVLGSVRAAIFLREGAVLIHLLPALSSSDLNQVCAPISARCALGQVLPVPVGRPVLPDIVAVGAKQIERGPVHVAPHREAPVVLARRRRHNIHELLEVDVPARDRVQLAPDRLHEAVDLLLGEEPGLNVPDDGLDFVHADRAAPVPVEGAKRVPELQLVPAEPGVEGAGNELLEVHRTGPISVEESDNALQVFDVGSVLAEV
mmetsp:Transcript_97872/g.192192  ORF Transcript_97872/g.192192 Transcript_97872/m.192192 type:complete len:264 (+) Transcript_97872:41-832(+)